MPAGGEWNEGPGASVAAGIAAAGIASGVAGSLLIALVVVTLVVVVVALIVIVVALIGALARLGVGRLACLRGLALWSVTLLGCFARIRRLARIRSFACVGRFA